MSITSLALKKTHAVVAEKLDIDVSLVASPFRVARQPILSYCPTTTTSADYPASVRRLRCHPFLGCGWNSIQLEVRKRLNVFLENNDIRLKRRQALPTTSRQKEEK